MKAYLVGPLPRTEQLIKAFRDYSKNKISREILFQEAEKTSRHYVDIQMKNGLTYVVDGMVTWHDLLRPFAQSLENTEINGLSRWFDNNFFFKIPVITGKIELKNSFERIGFFHHLVDERKRKIILPDPYCFARLSENKFYHDFHELVLDVAEALVSFINMLGPFSQIQLNSPCIVYRDISASELQSAMAGIELIRRKTEGELFLHLPFGDASNYLSKLSEFEVDVLGIDLYRTSLDKLRGFETEKALYLGMLDGRNTILEDTNSIVSEVAKVEKIVKAAEIHVGPNCELEHIPHDYAVKKIELLGQVLRRMP